LKIQEIKISQEVLALKAEMIGLRRHFHQYPELGNKEVKTGKYIAGYLKKLGLVVKENIAKTGVIGLLKGNYAGKTILYRADMDALEIDEKNNVEYKSKHTGIAHMCGHDAHMAIALITAKLFSAQKNKLRGNIKFVFQPSEELIPGGAKAMIEEGVMKNPEVGGALGLHVWQDLAVGKVGIKPGPLFASIDLVSLRVIGKGGHGAMPQYTVDPIMISAHIITSLQALITREIDPLQSSVLTFGQIHAGTACNIIPEESFLQGSLRCFNPEIRKYAAKRITEISKGIADAFGGRCEVDIARGHPTVNNDPEFTSIVLQAARETVPNDNISNDCNNMGSEDMAYFFNKAPGCLFLLGTSNKEKGLTSKHHSPRFNIDEDALPIGAEIVRKTILKFLDIHC